MINLHIQPNELMQLELESLNQNQMILYLHQIFKLMCIQIFHCARSRHRQGVGCYIRNNLYIIKLNSPKDTVNIIFEL